MLENALIVSLIVIFIHLMLQEGEIFGFAGKWFESRLPDKLQKPVFGCPICMAPWWGSIVMLIAANAGIERFENIDTWHWLFILAIAGGICTVYVELKPKKEIEIMGVPMCDVSPKPVTKQKTVRKKATKK